VNNFLKGLLGLKREPEKAPDAPFTPVNTLERLLVAAADPTQRSAFLKALSSADVYAAMEGAARPVAEWTSLRPGEKIALLNTPAPDGSPAIAVFTSPEQLFRHFGPDVSVLQISGGRFLQLVAASGAHLNPGTPFSIYWSPMQIAAMLGKPVEWKLSKDS
jgi:hypothetical protein